MRKLPYSIEEQREMLSWLERGEMPTKYVYFGVGSKKWISIAQRRLAEPTSINMLERILITKKAASIFDSLAAYGYKNFNIIDFGCGDGSPAYPIFQYLKANRPKALLRYNPIDISTEMLAAASKNIRGGFGVVGEKNRWDLDLGDFSRISKGLSKPNMGNLYMFLGATLCNMPDMLNDLVNFRKSMRQDDYLLLGAEMLKSENVGAIIKEFYGVREIFDILMTPFDYLGVRRSHFAFRTIFNREKEQIEGYVIPDRDIEIRLAGRQFTLEKGEEILGYRSVRFTTERLVGLFERAGFRLEMYTTSRENNYALALAQPAI